MAAPASSPAVPADLTAFTSRYMAAWNACDTAAMGELVTEDIVWTDPALAEPARGVPAVQQFMRDSFRAFPDLDFSEPDPPVVAVTGDTVLWAWAMHGTNNGPLDPPGFAPTKRTIHVEGVDQWKMQGGRIARYRAFYDLNDLVRQLGIVPPAGSAGERAMVTLQRIRARLSR